MSGQFTPEALELWNQLSDEEKRSWTTDVCCQKCSKQIAGNDYNGSIYEGQLALFHECKSCGNKEVRLIDVTLENQKEIDDDFEQWLKAKKAAHPDRF